MTTIHGFTKERMLEIEANTIVSAVVIDNHLILTKFNDDTIDAGIVRGPQGDLMPDVIATAVELNALHLSLVTATELNQIVGVTSPLQSQLNSKQPLSAELTAIAALAPSNDDFIQRKAGVWSKRTIAQVKTDLGIASTISSRRRHLIAQAVATGSTGAIVPYNTSDLNEIPWDAVNNLFAVPTDGYYQVNASCHFIFHATGYRTIVIRKNGVDVALNQTMAVTLAGAGAGPAVGTTLKLLAGDTIAIAIKQASGANLDTTATSAYNFVDITRLGI